MPPRDDSTKGRAWLQLTLESLDVGLTRHVRGWREAPLGTFDGIADSVFSLV